MKILITGGTGDLGRKMTEHLVKQGHEVHVIGRKSKEKIDQSYLSMLTGYTECDLSNFDKLEESFATTIHSMGRVDVLINNAAVRQFTKKFEEFTSVEVRNNVMVDFIAPLILTNLCIKVMKMNNFGRIINISSIGAFKVFPNGSLYCSSKSALIAFGETLNLELAELKGSITVNTICPDSFSKMDGTKLKNYHLITDSVLVNIDRIIRSSNGKVITSFTARHKLRERLRFIKRALFLS